MSTRLLHGEVCETCKTLAARVVVFHGYHPLEDIAVCKDCLIKGYRMLKEDEERAAAEGMRNIHGTP